MKKLLLIPIINVLVFYLGCSNSLVDTNYNNNTEKITIINDTVELKKRITYINENIDIEPLRNNFSQSSINNKKPSLKILADIEVPIFICKSYSASYGLIKWPYAYISYHTHGESIEGVVEIIKISDPKKLKIMSLAFTKDRDWNSIVCDDIYKKGHNYKMYLVGSNANGAVVSILNTKNGKIVNMHKSYQLPGVSGNSLAIGNNELYVSVGGSNEKGGIFKLDKNDLSIISQYNSSYAKYIDFKPVNNTLFTLFGGSHGYARVFKNNTIKNGYAQEWPLGDITPYDGKNGVVIDNNYAYLALGEKGLLIMNYETGEVIKNINFGKNIRTNSVSIDKDYIYVANGGAGFYLLDIKTHSILGKIKFPGSANHVFTNGKIIILANGWGGIKILQYK